MQEALSKKVLMAEDVIRKSYLENDGNIFISFSGGKDSTVLRDIALKMFPNIKVVFSNTTNELQEVLQYVKSTPNVITVVPEMNFKEVIRNYGFPLVSKEVSQKVSELKHTNGEKTRLLRYYGGSNGNSKLSTKWRFLAEQDFDVTNKCCEILKKRPLRKWANEHGLKPVIALMKDESSLRKQLALYGVDNGKNVYPFLNTGWTEEDIWEYAKEHNIRFAECYYDKYVDGKLIEKRDRTGCEYCMFGVDQESDDRFARSMILTPKRYDGMMRLENNGVSFIDAKTTSTSKQKNPSLGIFGGVVDSVSLDDSSNTETYEFSIVSDVVECTCCSKKGSKTAKKKICVSSSFVDSPNELNGMKRVIGVKYDLWECNVCGMTLNNHLHMFDLRFGVTKRLIDYIFENIDKMSSFDVAKNTGVDIDDIHEIIHFYYKDEILEAHENKYPSIWFDGDNNLITRRRKNESCI